jgi:DTW domain-containing protein YfiP
MHHELTLASYHKVLGEWNNSINKDRCAICWLRNRDCYCNYLNNRKNEYPTFNNMNIIIYYYFQEIGRSANTIHTMEVLLPSNTSHIIYGDSIKENQLMKQIITEQINGNIKTCILYPSPESISIASWVNNCNSITHNNALSASHSSTSSNEPINIVILDGTYTHAARQVHYIYITYYYLFIFNMYLFLSILHIIHILIMFILLCLYM